MALTSFLFRGQTARRLAVHQRFQRQGQLCLMHVPAPCVSIRNDPEQAVGIRDRLMDRHRIAGDELEIAKGVDGNVRLQTVLREDLLGVGHGILVGT